MAGVLMSRVFRCGYTSDGVEWMTSFRFSDDNPEFGRSLARSRFRDLPEFVQDVVDYVLGLRPAEWDALVDEDAVLEFTGVSRYRISPTLPCVARVKRKLDRGISRDGMCADCDGSLVTLDTDGSLTGDVGRPARCWCVQDWARTSARYEVAA